jgi:hypothetical protein
MACASDAVDVSWKNLRSNIPHCGLKDVWCSIPHLWHLRAWFGALMRAQDDEALTPKLIRASISKGTLHAFGLDIPLPIRCCRCCHHLQRDSMGRSLSERRLCLNI